jgi:hypothetical protein
VPNRRKASKISVNVWVERDVWARFAALATARGERPRTLLLRYVEEEVAKAPPEEGGVAAKAPESERGDEG